MSHDSDVELRTYHRKPESVEAMWVDVANINRVALRLQEATGLELSMGEAGMYFYIGTLFVMGNHWVVISELKLRTMTDEEFRTTYLV